MRVCQANEDMTDIRVLCSAISFRNGRESEGRLPGLPISQLMFSRLSAPRAMRGSGALFLGEKKRKVCFGEREASPSFLDEPLRRKMKTVKKKGEKVVMPSASVMSPFRTRLVCFYCLALLLNFLRGKSICLYALTLSNVVKSSVI